MHIDENTIMESLKQAAKAMADGVDDIEVHDWPSENTSDAAFFYIETGSVEGYNRQRFSVEVREFEPF